MEGKKLDQYFKLIKIVTPFILVVLGILGYMAFYSNQFTDVGYEPTQPIPFSHERHVGQVGLSCFYCHGNAEKSASAGIPSTQTCMNCHRFIKTDSPHIEKVHESYNNNVPIEWVRVHKLGDYAHFKHNVHIQAGVSCTNCHGDVAKMNVVKQVKPLNMGWCLDCHRGKTKVEIGEWTKYKVHGEWKKDHQGFIAKDKCSICHY
ncbi:MAG: cytochrome c3 family protein [Deltaproteobacteria bacterium]|nr:cytochrome c3 family protein [Deltaproteobacteria bacterium]